MGGRWFWWVVLGGLIVAGGLAVALTAGGGDSTSGKLETAKKVTVDGAALPTLTNSSADAGVGRTAPTLTGQTFDRKPIVIGNDGKPHVLVFVAHWCPHCQAEVPRIVKLAKKEKLAGVEIDAVATNTDSSYPNYPPSKWLKREHWPFTPVLADDAKARALVAFGGDSFPFFVVVGANGKVVARASGEIAPADIVRVIKRLLAGKSVFS
jgi:thiol-disulfide isomerase/thioredoxin